MKKTNIAIIGVGYWGPNILRTIKSIPECNLKTAIDHDITRSKYIKKIDNKVKISNHINTI